MPHNSGNDPSVRAGLHASSTRNLHLGHVVGGQQPWLDPVQGRRQDATLRPARDGVRDILRHPNVGVPCRAGPRAGRRAAGHVPPPRRSYIGLPRQPRTGAPAPAPAILGVPLAPALARGPLGRIGVALLRSCFSACGGCFFALLG